MAQVQRLGSGESPMVWDEEAAAWGACAGEHRVGRRGIRAGRRSGAVGGSTGQTAMGSGREQGCGGRGGLACGGEEGRGEGQREVEERSGDRAARERWGSGTRERDRGKEEVEQGRWLLAAVRERGNEQSRGVGFSRA